MTAPGQSTMVPGQSMKEPSRTEQVLSNLAFHMTVPGQSMTGQEPSMMASSNLGPHKTELNKSGLVQSNLELVPSMTVPSNLVPGQSTTALHTMVLVLSMTVPSNLGQVQSTKEPGQSTKGQVPSRKVLSKMELGPNKTVLGQSRMVHRMMVLELSKEQPLAEHRLHSFGCLLQFGRQRHRRFGLLQLDMSIAHCRLESRSHCCPL